MIVLADNDIVHKLACCELLQELLQWLKVPPNEVWILPSLQYVLRKKLKTNAPALACLETFLKSTQAIPSAETEHLERFSALDVGERQMLAVFVDDKFDCSQLVTGDKRALKLIAALSATDARLYQQLDGCVECLESIMLGLIDHFGFDYISAKVVGGIGVDGVFRLAFGQGRDQEHALGALNSYFAALRVEAAFVGRTVDFIMR